MPAAHLLVVDDEVEILDIFRDVLSEEGHQVSTAASGEEALKLAESESFDLVFLDVKLPGISGLEVLPALRKLRPDQKVVMITGVLDDDLYDLSLYSRNPANGFLTKPCSFRSITDCVRRVLEEDGTFIRTPRDEFRHAAAKVRQSFEEAGRSLGVAEVLTGGVLGNALTDAFTFDSPLRGSLHLHGCRAVAELLGRESIDPVQVFTGDTAGDLAEAAARRLGSEVGVGLVLVTDLWALHGTPPLGSAFLGIAGAGPTRVVRKLFRGGRHELARAASYFAMVEVRATLSP